LAFSCGFYNSLNHDRLYDAIQHCSVFDGIITDGVLATIYNQFRVAAQTGMTISIDTGRAWFNHTWTLNDAIILMDVPAADVLLPRIDAVVLTIDGRESTRDNQPRIIKGTPSANPQRPSMASGDPAMFNYPLAFIAVAANQTAITAANITNAVGTAQTPFAAGVLTGFDLDLFIQQMEQQWIDWQASNQASMDFILNALQEQISRIEAGTEVMLKTEYAPDSIANIDGTNVAINSVYTHANTDYFVSFNADFALPAFCSLQIDNAPVSLVNRFGKTIFWANVWKTGDFVMIRRKGDTAILITPSGDNLSSNSLLYVSTTGDDTNGNGSSSAPFKTFAKAISMVPACIERAMTINVAQGTYNEPLLIERFYGTGILTVTGPATFLYSNISYCSTYQVNLTSITCSQAIGMPNDISFITSACSSYVSYNSCVTTAVNTTTSTGFYTSSSPSVMLYSCTASSKYRAILADYRSSCYCYDLRGTNNVMTFSAQGGSLLSVFAAYAGATYSAGIGGLIVKGSGAILGS
jgi:hypothetical protein